MHGVVAMSFVEGFQKGVFWFHEGDAPLTHRVTRQPVAYDLLINRLDGARYQTPATKN